MTRDVVGCITLQWADALRAPLTGGPKGLKTYCTGVRSR